MHDDIQPAHSLHYCMNYYCILRALAHAVSRARSVKLGGSTKLSAVQNCRHWNQQGLVAKKNMHIDDIKMMYICVSVTDL